ncbi:PREDICTED: protein FAR1-RELATED SEQUENCE 5-like [Ipomoea nil]|uniref:protein FAR1-RELATED SEQUENCE 5-like n=1 Tax=Ipomoea nil TaxID=35883 RepID=UPI0009012F2C|nr:PREDICTED: protein FAR1-RELATED SEQUENCE 5-like [Ipomoea nil]
MATHGAAPPAIAAAGMTADTGLLRSDSGIGDATHSTRINTTFKQYWIPNVDANLLPTVEQRFNTLDEGIKFYKTYGRAGGFHIRYNNVKRNRDNQIISRHLVCSRQGAKGGGQSKPILEVSVGNDNKKQRRRRISNRVGCRAKLGFKRVSTGEFMVSIFIEEHNHSLCSEGAKLFLRCNRKLNVAQQAFLANCVKVNVGSSAGFKLCKEVAGSFENVGATEMEFHNFKRDLQKYVDVVDGELIIERLKTKRKLCDSFFFDYHLNEENRLSRLFWADPIGRGSFSCYGDVISFDATYSTNRYNLVFVPFTGVDNHKRSITYAAGLITREDVESYSWLLERLISATTWSPLCVVTDQDPAMKIAIDQVIPECRHRYYMWHIMTKVSEKVGPGLAQNEVFRKSLNDIVWNERISSSDFEAQWQLLMEKYNLTEHRWFRKLFVEREHWIPAFFSDLPLSGLVRTTSRSEAQNSVYGKFTRPCSSLVQFYIQFESVLETQHHNQTKLDTKCEGYLPEFKTPLALERNAAQLFTLAIFYDMQEEIEAACFNCQVVGIREVGGDIFYDITNDSPAKYTVRYTPDGCSTFCSCKMFQRMGLICRNMFLVFKSAQLKQLSAQYIVLKELSVEFASDGSSTGTAKGNSAAIEALCGVQPPAFITIKAPAQAKNKGSGKRLKSSREIAIENSSKVG